MSIIGAVFTPFEFNFFFPFFDMTGGDGYILNSFLFNLKTVRHKVLVAAPLGNRHKNFLPKKLENLEYIAM